jgi:cytochrome c oxidase subunit II
VHRALTPRRLRLARRVVAGGLLLLLTAGCSQDTAAQWGRWGMPVGISQQSNHIGSLWSGAWTASMIVGLIVWGLIGYAALRFRRRHRDERPKQNRYNVPLEIMYTMLPFLIIAVLFLNTVRTQDAVMAQTDKPDHTIMAIGQKWSWTFNYYEQDTSQVGAVIHQAGTIENYPDLYLPVNQKILFKIESDDVDHSFWIPEFYMKMDAIPGRTNTFEVTPTKTGSYLGKCAELCGAYHSQMLFNVHVVTLPEYYSYLNDLKAKGQTGEIAVNPQTTAVPVPSAKESTK